MYASVRQYTLKTGHEQVEVAARDVQKDLGPLIGQTPGFVAYCVLDTGNNVVIAMSIFESRAAEETANKIAADWIRQHLASLASSPPSIAEGEVIAHYAK
jgi:hypothetical protein